ncbi:MAG TPA: hypothetical protein HPP87_13320 [Planctomycetes bacterium]|nr:hypothetical protein [Planctomycetota bacterium]
MNRKQKDRVDIKSFLYLRICKEHHNRYVESCKKYTQCENVVDELQKNGVMSIGLGRVMARDEIEAMEQSYAIVVVFAAMCMEAFIYDYAAQNLSGKFVKNHIDKLDLKPKWVIVPQLVTGKKFDTGSKAFELLVKLVKYRNELVHAKSRNRPSSAKLDQLIKTNAAKEEDKLTIVKNACETRKQLIKELDSLDSNKHKPWWWQVMRNGINGGVD